MQTIADLDDSREEQDSDQRRRFMFHVLAACTEEGLLNRRAPRLGCPVPKGREWWFMKVPQYDDKTFQRCFRVPRVIFQRLVHHARGHEIFAASVSNAERTLDVDHQVGIALWRQGRAAAVRDAAQLFGVSDGSVINASARFNSFMKREFLQSEICDRWPRTAEQCAALAAGMRARVAEPHSMEGCIGALDGTLVPIWVKRGFEEHYFCRKQFCALNFQVVADYRSFIIWTSGGRGGRVWDGNAIYDEPLTQTLLPALPPNLFVVGDSGYVGSSRLLTPYKKPKNAELTPQQARFNYYHSLTRGVIEKTFGILKARNRWALKGVQYASIQAYADHFVVACILHNMVNEHYLRLSHSQQMSEREQLLREINNERLQPYADDVDRDALDDDRYMGLVYDTHLCGRRFVEAYYIEQLAHIRAALHGNAAPEQRVLRENATREGETAELIPEEAQDTVDNQVDIADLDEGKELRRKVFDQMGMSSWEPVADSDSAAEATAATRGRGAAAGGNRGRGSVGRGAIRGTAVGRARGGSRNVTVSGSQRQWQGATRGVAGGRGASRMDSRLPVSGSR